MTNSRMAMLRSRMRKIASTIFFVAVLIALAAGVPAGYVLARKKFPGRSVLMLTMLLGGLWHGAGWTGSRAVWPSTRASGRCGRLGRRAAEAAR